MYCMACQESGTYDISSWCCVLNCGSVEYNGIYQALIEVPIVCGIVTCWSICVDGQKFRGVSTPHAWSNYAVSEPFPIATGSCIDICYTSNNGADTTRAITASLIEWPIGNMMCVCRDAACHTGGLLSADVNCWLGCAVNGSTGYPQVDVCRWLGSAVLGSGGYPDINVCKWLGTNVCGTLGYPDINVVRWLSCDVCSSDCGAFTYPQVDICLVGAEGVAAADGYLQVDVCRWLGSSACGGPGKPSVDVSCWNCEDIPAGGPLGVPQVDVCYWSCREVAGCYTGGTMYPLMEVCRWAGCAVGVHENLPCVFACDAGTGSISVDHDYGGTDALAYIVDGGTAVEDAIVQAFLTTVYDAGNRTRNYVKGETRTDANGRWETEMRLNAGAYTLVYYKQGEYGPDTTEITVTALP